VCAQRPRAPVGVVREVLDDDGAAREALPGRGVGERANLEARADEPVGPADARAAHQPGLLGALEQVHELDLEPVGDGTARRLHQLVERGAPQRQLPEPRHGRLLGEPACELAPGRALGAQLVAVVEGERQRAGDRAVVAGDRHDGVAVVLVVAGREAPHL